VQVAHTGADALLLAMRTHPTLVILDIGLTDMSGIDVARELRRLPQAAGPASLP
jgi:DNA-binding response OmpR family regulator